jgi:uncharacterized protein
MLRVVLVLLGFLACGHASDLVSAARAQVGVTTSYDPSYLVLAYPGGDPPPDRGVCTDVVIRALRTARNTDLQVLVHQDMKAHFSEYPKIWGLRSTDRNIDHRRVPNLITYFRRRGYERPLSDDPGKYRPGDVVTCIVPPNLPHVMIVSDQTTPEGTPLVIHNIGRGTVEEDRLFAFKLTAHFRLPPAQSGSTD